MALVLLSLAQAPRAQAHFDPCPSFMRDESAVLPTTPGEFVFSPYTLHWSHADEHKVSVLLGYDHYLPGGGFCGASVFTNSFGQPSTYVYVGKTWEHPWKAHPRFFVSVTGGILYGYVGAHKHAVPLNYNGFSPGAIPDFGYRLTEVDDLNLYVVGFSGFMFAYSRRF